MALPIVRRLAIMCRIQTASSCRWIFGSGKSKLDLCDVTGIVSCAMDKKDLKSDLLKLFEPKLLLQIEGAAVLLVACVCYHHLQGHWLWFWLFFLVPDASMLGYLANKRFGAMTYNVVHTFATPLIVLFALLITNQNSYLWLVLIWFAHIGFDRLIGYGLKYETNFKDTHLQRL